MPNESLNVPVEGHVVPFRLLFGLVALLAALAPAQPAAAQTCAAACWRPGPGVPGVDTGSVVEHLAVVSRGPWAGDLLVGGSFSSAGSVPARMARFSPASNTWSAIENASSGSIIGVETYATITLADGDLLIGGLFSQFNGVPASGIVRFSPATGISTPLGRGVRRVLSGGSSRVKALLELPGGEVLVGGNFDTAGDLPSAASIARLNPGTGAWTRAGGDIRAGTATGTVNSLALLPSGEVVVGGVFTSVAGQAAANIARYNPTTDQWSPIGVGMTGTASQFASVRVEALLTLPSGDVLVGGWFTAANGVAATNIARFNPSTGVWSPVGNTSGVVTSLALVSDGPNAGQVAVGGTFSVAGGQSRPYVARFNPATNAWSALGSGPGNFVGTVAVLPGGDIVAGGENFQINGMETDGVVRFATQANAWTTLGGGPVGTVNATAPLPDPAGGPAGSTVLVGGILSTAGGGPAGLARYDTRTGAWTPTGTRFNNAVTAMAALPGGDMLIGGAFTSINSAAFNRIARYSPQTNSFSPLGAGLDSGTVYAIAIAPNGDWIIAGSFARSGTTVLNGIARYSPSTGTWSPIAGGLGSSVNTAFDLVLLPDGDILVGRNSSSSAAFPPAGITRFRAAQNAWTSVGGGLGGSSRVVYDLELLPDGDVLVAGEFTSAGGLPVRNIARYRPATDSWSSIDAPRAGSELSCSSLAVLPDGDIVVACLVQNNLSPANNVYAISRYQAATGTWMPIACDLRGSVRTLSVAPDGTLLVGGGFERVNGVISASIARYASSDAAPAVTLQPAPARAAPGGVATFALAASGDGPRSYRWQIRSAPNHWRFLPISATPPPCGTAVIVDTPDAGPVASIRLDPCQALGTTVRFRCVITTPCGELTSAETTLSVCYADFDRSGSRDVSDIFALLQAWFALNARADVNGSGACDVNDIFVFLDQWFGGCP